MMSEASAVESPSSDVLYKTLVYSFTIPLIFITTVGKHISF
jgi:hypothetical protein